MRGKGRGGGWGGVKKTPYKQNTGLQIESSSFKIWPGV